MLLVLLPVDLSRGRLLIPMSDLARFQVTRGELQKAEAGPALDELIRYRARRAREIIEDGGIALPGADPARLRHLMVQAALDRARLKRVAKAGSRSLQVHRDIAPVRRLFIAWRAAGQAQRQRARD